MLLNPQPPHVSGIGLMPDQLRLAGRAPDPCQASPLDIPNATDELRKAIEGLRENVAILLSRLDIVSTPAAPKDGAPRAIAAQCPLGGEIRSAAADVASITASVVDAMQRLQLP